MLHKSAVAIIQAIAPGPPVESATAVPTIVPVPRFPPIIAATAAKLLILFSFSRLGIIYLMPLKNNVNCGHFNLMENSNDVTIITGATKNKTKYFKNISKFIKKIFFAKTPIPTMPCIDKDNKITPKLKHYTRSYS